MSTLSIETAPNLENTGPKKGSAKSSAPSRRGVATLLEAAKDMLSRITRRHDGLAEWPDSSIIGNIERLRAQELDAACRRPK